MYTLEDLFDRRSPVGTRLEQILMEKKCTKAELSKKTGVSRLFMISQIVQFLITQIV